MARARFWLSLVDRLLPEEVMDQLPVIAIFYNPVTKGYDIQTVYKKGLQMAELPTLSAPTLVQAIENLQQKFCPVKVQEF